MNRSGVAVIAAWLVAISAGEAASECAWVLYSRFKLPDPVRSQRIENGMWLVEAAVPTYSACR